jgi:predicted MFS family arabinose efflux permease
MSESTRSRAAAPVAVGVLITCAVITAALAMGVRQSFGLFFAPLVEARGWTASGVSLAFALLVLMNGFTQPLMGQLADRFGGRVVVVGGTLLQAASIAGMALTDDLLVFTLLAALGMGLAVSAAGMPVIMASLTRLLPEAQRGRATGFGTAGSSLGQFFVVPLGQLMMLQWGWQAALLLLAASSLLMIPLALPLTDNAARQPKATGNERAGPVVAAALRTPTFWYLFAGFFVCGLHVSFLAYHLPGFAALCGLPGFVGAAAVSLLGLFNIAGSLISGELTSRWKRRELLVIIYASRAVLFGVFMLLPKTTPVVLGFAAIMGVLYLSTVPPTVALCARNFGTRWLATVFGLVFLGHQLGGFTGAWLGGVVLDRTGSYDLMWWFGTLAAVFAALVNLPVRDGPPAVAKPAAA